MTCDDIKFEVEEGNYWLEDTRSLFLPFIKDIMNTFHIKAENTRIASNEDSCILLLKQSVFSTIVIIPKDPIENAVAEKREIRLNWFDVLDAGTVPFWSQPFIIKLREREIGDKFLNEL